MTTVVPFDTTGLPPGATFGATAPALPTGSTFDATMPPGGATVGVTVGPTMPAAGLSSVPVEAGPLKVGQSFGPRYHVIRLLGAGGMGAVYQAWDAELGVAVALKVIRVDNRRTESAEAEKRFKQELLLARQVTHKHVVRIHDLGEIDGIKYLTMPYVQGHDLASTLRTGGRLPTPTAIRLARQIAAGLQAAHDAGVVHRDLKPANIMISGENGDRQALIMDFGISASTEATTESVVVGTLEYMAPEQAKGEADARSDIYAYGLILYEMLTGPRIVGDATPQSRVEAMRQRCAEGLVPLRMMDASIPEPLDRFVMRCVATNPAARFQTAAELVSALNELRDTGERIPLVARVTTPMMAGAAVMVLLLLGGTYVATRRLMAPVKPHDPVSVVIADLKNSTGDPGFDHALESVLKRALEGASFISAYDRNSIRSGLGVRPPAVLDDAAARELAAKQGVGVVVSGTVDRQGSGYGVAIKAVQTITGNLVGSATGSASTKEQVVPVATKLVASVRKALGDRTSESAQMFAMTSLSASSLDVLRYYTAAQDAGTNNRFEEAREQMLKAVALDPKFGIGYQLLSVYSRNLGDVQDAEKYSKEALRYLDGMTERERYATRGLYYRMTGDYQQCVKEYGDLVTRYAGDAVAHNQRALCLSKLHDMRGAVDEMREAVRVLPKRLTFRDNLALYADYSGDFEMAAREARAPEQPDAYGFLAIAFSQLGQGRVKEATDTYQQLATMQGALGASFAASGLADIALYEGRFGESARKFEEGAAADLARKSGDKAATKLVSAASAHLAAGRRQPAVADADKALASSQAVSIQFLAARVYVDAGLAERARALGASLGKGLSAEAQAYAKIVEADLALKTGDPRSAIKSLNDANGLLDTWIGHFDLGRAYLAADAIPQADSQFDRCIKRRGEALSLFMDEEPTLGFFPAVYYYQGRVREALGNAGFADSYRAYLEVRGQSTDDPLLREVRRRAAGRDSSTF